ncbi:hypothetical protein [Streptomyces sp. CC210A]|uniref:hypothetical protein n=1 Tax=Streptomyces sp. CC210A TaxID=2898184 RepID=UPI001F405E83|nr:hypothetical protein [Streptomyces sp. CC210A]
MSAALRGFAYDMAAADRQPEAAGANARSAGCTANRTNPGNAEIPPDQQIGRDLVNSS